MTWLKCWHKVGVLCTKSWHSNYHEISQDLVSNFELHNQSSLNKLCQIIALQKTSEEDIPNLKFSSVPADGLAPLGAMQFKVGLKSLGKGFVVWHVRIISNTNA